MPRLADFTVNSETNGYYVGMKFKKKKLPVNWSRYIVKFVM